MNQSNHAVAYIKNLTGAEADEITKFLNDISSNQYFLKAMNDKQDRSGRRRFSSWGISSTLGEVLYAMCRVLKPATVVETGVASGISSSYILQSLEDNNIGSLLSIDLPMWERESGLIIPDYLRQRWHLIKGRTVDKLTPLLEETGSIDVFLHDSEHTYKNMLFEFQAAWANMNSGGILLSHNIDTNNAWFDFCHRVNRTGYVFHNLGGLVKP